MASTKLIQFNILETCATGGNHFIGQWKNGPHDNCRRKDRLEYYISLAKLAEKGKFTSIFFADSYGANDVYGGSTDATYRGGSQVAQLDPFVIVSAMAAVTETLGFALTANAIYLNPFILARSFSSLEHITNGRIGWNIVTGYTNSSALAMGFDSIMPHDQRYAKAGEFVDLTYRLWEGGWDDDAQVFDVVRDTAYDPERLHKTEFSGKFHKLSAIHQVHPSPQRTPVIFQAGASSAGIALAGANAEGLYCGSISPARTAQYVKTIREAAKASGRDPNSVKAFAGVATFIGRTFEEAQGKYQRALQNASATAGLGRFCAYTGIDLSTYPLDEPFHFEAGATNAVQGVIESFKAGNENNDAWTPRKLGERMSCGGMYPHVVGTPEMVADFMEKWMEETDVDGFNLYASSSPGTMQDAVELLVPVLQARGRYWKDYAVPRGTLRENMYVQPGHGRVSDDHPAAKHRREREAERKSRDLKTDCSC
ncbi:hypothetical protein KJ359_005229 [Pestalotiopsis sp. 9143b]|nr:hypothetical protein KJ359_005229 [Pestalotiopsis sp. 9143b]